MKENEWKIDGKIDGKRLFLAVFKPLRGDSSRHAAVQQALRLAHEPGPRRGAWRRLPAATAFGLWHRVWLLPKHLKGAWEAEKRRFMASHGFPRGIWGSNACMLTHFHAFAGFRRPFESWLSDFGGSRSRSAMGPMRVLFIGNSLTYWPLSDWSSRLPRSILHRLHDYFDERPMKS